MSSSASGPVSAGGGDEAEKKRLGYWILGAPFGALLGITHSMVRRRTEDGVVTFTTGEASAIAAGAVTLVLLYMLLPTVILGWTEPDPPGGDDDENA